MSLMQVKNGSVAIDAKGLLDGTMSVADLISFLSLEGRIFTANVGSATTPITFGAGGLNTAEFDLHVLVPAGTRIIPLELYVSFDVFGTALLVEVVMTSGKGSTAGAGTAVTPVSSNTNIGLGSACTLTRKCTATSGVFMTSEVKEIFHASRQLAITIETVAQVREQEAFRWYAKDSGILDVVGPSAQLAIFAASNAGEGFITLKYAEIPAGILF